VRRKRPARAIDQRIDDARIPAAGDDREALPGIDAKLSGKLGHDGRRAARRMPRG
jgi:hypothetical protein